MTNIKQRARDLLTCDELRGRLPEEVQAFLRDVLRELEDVGDEEMYLKMELARLHREYLHACEPYMQALCGIAARKPFPHYIYHLGSPNDPA